MVPPSARADRLPRVVRRLDGHLDVVRVRLLESGRGDAYELAALLEFGNGAGTHVEHRLPPTANQWVARGAERAAVGHAALDALGDELGIRGHVGLEVAVARVRGLLAAV